MEGTPFGRYRLLELLGRGGMGEVWRAHDTDINRTVAVKLLAPQLAQDDTFVTRFRREAEAAARLNNPHIIPIHNCGEIDGRLYVDMRLVEGRDLQEVLADGPMDPARAVRIIEQVAKALQAAHKIGLVHRDVKPSNILLDEDDFAYLIDFGIARGVDETRLTGTNTMIGSWHYMAPERLRAHEADARADIYALACVLYECLTGHHPFPGDSLESQVAAHLTTPPPVPSTEQPNVPAQFDAVIAKGMAKNPGNRYATTVALAHAARDAVTVPFTPRTSSPRAEPPTRQAGPVTGPWVPHNVRQTPPSSPRIDRSQGTRGFSERWPNPQGPDYTPYREHLPQPETPERRTGFGRGQMVLAVAGAALLAAAVVGVLWVVIAHNRARDVGSTPSSGATATQSSTVAEQNPPTSAAITQPHLNGLPGTDDLGFTGTAARCTPDSKPVLEARTAQSLVVICQTGPGSYYYRGLRLSDNASIELPNAVRSTAGFDVTNPVDGTRYEVRPTVVNIKPPDGQVFSEPVLDYASN